jgi:hypothetical protein
MLIAFLQVTASVYMNHVRNFAPDFAAQLSVEVPYNASAKSLKKVQNSLSLSLSRRSGASVV